MAEMEQGYIDSLIEKAQKAQKEFESYSQEQVDAIVKAMGKIIYDNAELIAKEAVEETGYGRVDSKILKITRCTTAAWHYLHDKKSVGMIDWDPVEKLATLKPAFTKDGIVTAGNSSAINDGAAALVVMSEEKAKELGVEPLATWVAGALAGVEPEVMGLGPIAATKKVMAKTGLTVADMDLIEANEAFAAQSVAVSQALNFDMSKVNVNGGAIALGHPVGASGARILVTLLYAMKHRGAHKGLATLCIGGGMGCATIVEMD